MSKLRNSCVLTAALLSISLAATAQTFRGGVAGNVADPSGAAISGATVKIVNVKVCSVPRRRTAGERVIAERRGIE